MKAYKNYFNKKKFKKSEMKSRGIFSLPLYPELNETEVRKICKILTKILNNV